IRDSGIPYTIGHSTQFFEFLPRMIQSAADRQTVRQPPALVQPVAAADVANSGALPAVERPVNGIIESAGPGSAPPARRAEYFMAITHDPREVIPDPHAPYFGAELDAYTLMPGPAAWHGRIDFEEWVIGQPQFVPAGASSVKTP